MLPAVVFWMEIYRRWKMEFVRPIGRILKLSRNAFHLTLELASLEILEADRVSFNFYSMF
jgi:hypothetical protein